MKFTRTQLISETFRYDISAADVRKAIIEYVKRIDPTSPAFTGGDLSVEVDDDGSACLHAKANKLMDPVSTTIVPG